MKNLIKFSVLMTGAFLGYAATAAAEEAKANEKELAACMWEKAPEEAAKAMNAQNPFQFGAALANGGEVCGASSSSVNIELMRKALRDAQPKKLKKRD